MILTLLAFLISLIISLIVVPEVIRNFIKNEVFDIPGGRKIHGDKIPSLGGIGIFVSFLVTSLFFLPSGSLIDVRYLMLGLILVFFMGIRDDLIGLSPNNKLIIQLVASIIVVGFGNVYVKSFYGLIDFPDFPNWGAMVFTTFILIVLTNSFNLIDGINGLAGGISFLICSILGVYFFSVGELKFAVLCASFSGAILGFLRYNWGEARIFMGDTGSMVLGFFITLMVIAFLNVNQSLADSVINKIETPVSFCFALLIYPIFDTVRIIFVRVKNGKSPFKSDNKHIHHVLLKAGVCHKKIAIILIFYTFFWVLTVYCLSFYLPDLLILSIIICSFILIPLFLSVQLNRNLF